MSTVVRFSAHPTIPAVDRNRPRRPLVLSDTIRQRFVRAAGRRGLSVDELAERLLEAIGTDGLIDAILDDEA